MTDRLHLLTFNVLTIDSASGRERHEVVRRLLPGLRADVVALQEVTRSPEFDLAVDLLGPDFAIVDLPGWTPEHVGECLASRWPLGEVSTLDRPLAGDAEEGPRAAGVAAEVLVRRRSARCSSCITRPLTSSRSSMFAKSRRSRPPASSRSSSRTAQTSPSS
jgi:Endonuclease/Exonuclease/phosphatase family